MQPHAFRTATRFVTSIQGPLVLVLICVVLSWKLVLTDQYTWLNGPDFANQVLPWFQFEAQQWHHGHFPLWDPYHWGGQSLIGQNQPGVVNPLNWILFLLLREIVQRR